MRWSCQVAIGSLLLVTACARPESALHLLVTGDCARGVDYDRLVVRVESREGTEPELLLSTELVGDEVPDLPARFNLVSGKRVRPGAAVSVSASLMREERVMGSSSSVGRLPELDVAELELSVVCRHGVADAGLATPGDGGFDSGSPGGGPGDAGDAGGSDAGALDAGVADGGAGDAGISDAGSLSGDGGATPDAGLLGLGVACVQGSSCQSGQCVDGVCCQSACAGTCDSCALPGLAGTCAPLSPGSPGTCPAGMSCTADGGCLLSLSSLADDFNDNVRDLARWSTYEDGSARVFERNAQLEMTTGTVDDSYAGFRSVPWLNGRLSSYSVQLKSAGNQSVQGVNAMIELIDRTDQAVLIDVYEGLVYTSFRDRFGNYTDYGMSRGYDPATMRYFRIREDAGTTYWEVSEDGGTFSVLTSRSNPITMDEVKVQLSGGTYRPLGSSETLIFDNVNR